MKSAVGLEFSTKTCERHTIVIICFATQSPVCFITHLIKLAKNKGA